MIAVNSLADAELVAFPGSPTIRIDGTDIHPTTTGEIRLGVRAYPSDDDQDGPLVEAVPGKRLIRRAVERARGWGHGRADQGAGQRS
jgi:hypothetical protein